MTIETIDQLFDRARNVESVEKTATAQQLLERAELMTTESSSSAIRELLQEAARANLDELDLDDIYRTLKKRTKKQVATLRKAYRQQALTRNLHTSDTGERIKNLVLSTYFNNGAYLTRTPQGQFWCYTGTHWQRRSDDQISNLILESIHAHGDPDDGSYSGQLAQALSLLRAATTTQHDPFGFTADPKPIINCRNGELHIDPQTGIPMLRPHTPSNMLTYCLPFDWQPYAKCPAYDAALEQIFALTSNPQALIAHWHEFVGYAIQPLRDIPSFFLLKGFGANGKSKLIETIVRLTGPDACASLRVESLADRFARSALLGKIIMVDDDVDAGTKLPDGILKSLSERKQLSVEFKGQTPFEAVLNILPILLCNNYPTSSDVTYGMVRRAYIIPFQRQFLPEEQDPGLFPRIWASEMPGVLNRALEGLQRLRLRSRFDPPEDCTKAKEIWMNAANPLKAFVSECLAEHEGYTISLSKLYSTFRQWAQDAGIRHVIARNTMKRNLEALGFTTSMSEGSATLRHYRLTGAGLEAYERMMEKRF